MIKAIIISGDRSSIEQVSTLISASCPDIGIDATASELNKSVSIINSYQPDLLILDTFLTDGSGFDLLNHFENPDFKTIFISEYPEYAIKAIEYSASGYLLKPINEKKFTASVNKVKNMIEKEEKLQLRLLDHTMHEIKSEENIILRTNEQIHSVKPSDIIRLEADGNYSTFYMNDGRKVIVSKPTSDFEEILVENGFFRIHKSHLINMRKLSYFEKAEGGSVVMMDGSSVPVASRKRDAVIELLEKLS
ncbi:MAG: LytTR family DNA-binding domain-containing protein [Bacteroidales bacterium]